MMACVRAQRGSDTDCYAYQGQGKERYAAAGLAVVMW